MSAATIRPQIPDARSLLIVQANRQHVMAIRERMFNIPAVIECGKVSTAATATEQRARQGFLDNTHDSTCLFHPYYNSPTLRMLNILSKIHFFCLRTVKML